jgi:protein transport protein HofC
VEYFSPIANGLGLICLAMGILIALRMLRIRGEPGEQNVMIACLTVFGWVCLIGGLIVITIMLLIVFSVPFWLLTAIIVMMALNRFFRNQRRSLLRVLVLATERQLPLAPAVAAFSRETSAAFGAQTWKLAGALQAGLPLGEALRSTRGVLSRSAVPAVHVGEATGTLSETLREAARPSEANHSLQQIVTQIFYVSNVVLFGLGILAFIMVKIVPEFRKIFADFEAELPAATEVLILLADWLAEFSALVSLMVPPLLLLGFYVTIRYLGWIEWDPPPINRMLRAVDVAVILRLLAIVVEANKPLAAGIDSLAQSHPKPWIRERLERVALDVSQGRDWCESFREHRLITAADAAMLASAQRVGNLPWAMRLVADSGERRLAYRLRACIQVVAPAVLLVLGGVVCFIITSLFLPLISLISKLSDT